MIIREIKQEDNAKVKEIIQDSLRCTWISDSRNGLF